MTARSNVFSNNEESGGNMVSSTKVIIETYISESSIRIVLRDISKDHKKNPLHIGNNVKAKCSIDELPEGKFFHYSLKNILSLHTNC